MESVDDPRFDSDFESLFPADTFDFPFYAILGNHDRYGNAHAQVQYSSHSDRWRMPGYYYKTRLAAGSQKVALFGIDTDPIATGDANASGQLDWLRRELSASDADYKIVMGHHPVITGGQHENSPAVAHALAPLFRQAGVDLYLSGHDHDLQLCDSGQDWLQVVSGSGSKQRSTTWIDPTVFAQASPGFCWLLVDGDRLYVSYYDAGAADRQGTHLFTHTLRARHTANIASVSSRTTKILID